MWIQFEKLWSLYSGRESYAYSFWNSECIHWLENKAEWSQPIFIIHSEEICVEC